MAVYGGGWALRGRPRLCQFSLTERALGGPHSRSSVVTTQSRFSNAKVKSISSWSCPSRWDPGTCWEVLLCPLSGGGGRRRDDDGEVEALAPTAAERKQRPSGLEEPFLRLVVACHRRLMFYWGASQGAACLLGTVLACQTSLVGGGRPELWGLPAGSR